MRSRLASPGSVKFLARTSPTSDFTSSTAVDGRVAQPAASDTSATATNAIVFVISLIDFT